MLMGLLLAALLYALPLVRTAGWVIRAREESSLLLWRTTWMGIFIRGVFVVGLSYIISTDYTGNSMVNGLVIVLGLFCVFFIDPALTLISPKQGMLFASTFAWRRERSLEGLKLSGFIQTGKGATCEVRLAGKRGETLLEVATENAIRETIAKIHSATGIPVKLNKG